MNNAISAQNKNPIPCITNRAFLKSEDGKMHHQKKKQKIVIIEYKFKRLRLALCDQLWNVYL